MVFKTCHSRSQTVFLRCVVQVDGGQEYSMAEIGSFTKELLGSKLRKLRNPYLIGVSLTFWRNAWNLVHVDVSAVLFLVFQQSNAELPKLSFLLRRKGERKSVDDCTIAFSAIDRARFSARDRSCKSTVFGDTALFLASSPKAALNIRVFI